MDLEKSEIPHSKPHLTERDWACLREVVTSRFVSKGNLTEKCESAFGDLQKVRGAVSTTSGSAALLLALKSMQLRPGDEIIMPTYVCSSVMNVILACGGKPVFCDIGTNWVLDISKIEPLINSRTRAIIAVHLFGIPLDCRPLLKYDLVLIEDCCQAIGASINNTQVGTIGQFSFYSFHATKLLTSGEGGMVCSKANTEVSSMKAIRDSGLWINDRFEFLPGQMSNLQSALLLSQLDQYEGFIFRRTQIAEYYYDSLANLNLELPEQIRDTSIFFRFPILSKLGFDKVSNEFNERKIQVRKGVDELCHRILNQDDKSYRESVSMFERTISIPIYPALSDSDVERIVDGCKSIFK